MSIRIYGNGTIQQSDGDEAVFQSGDADINDGLVWNGTEWVPGPPEDLQPGVRYQTGTWTIGSNTTVNTSAGTWVRVGNKVTAFIRVDHGTNSGSSSASFYGLPYPADVDMADEIGRSVGYTGFSNNGSTLGFLGNNTDGYAFNLRALDSTGGNLTVTQCNGLLFRGAIEYITDDTTFVPADGSSVTEDVQGTGAYAVAGSGGGGGNGTPGVRYQQGTWVPKLRGSGTAGTFTYTLQEGGWSRTGNIVSFWGRIGIDTASGATNTAWIQGIPYEVDDQVASVVGDVVSTDGITNVGQLVRGSTSGVYAYRQTTSGFAPISVTTFTAGTSIRFSGSYITNNTSFDPTDTVGGSLSTVTEDTQGIGGGGTAGVRYQEGDWSPTVTEGTVTASQTSWSRIGNSVTMYANLNSFTNATSLNTLQIQGLPYPCAPGIEQAAGSAFYRYVNAEHHLTTYITPNGGADAIYFYGGASGNFSSLQYAYLNHNGSTQIYLKATYTTNDTTFVPSGTGATLTTDIQGLSGSFWERNGTTLEPVNDGDNVKAASINNGHAGPENLIINGAMQVAQRGVGPVAVTTSDQFLLDRFRTYVDTTNVFTVDHSQSTDTPTGQGFKYSYKLEVSANAGGTTSTGFTVISQSIEGNNTAQLNYGTSDAKTITVSFWVKSSVSGTYSLTLRNATSNYNYTSEYTISSANTWEKVSKTIPGATAGAWVTDNGKGLEVMFGVDVGSTFAATPDSWGNANYFTTANSVDTWSDTLNNTFYLTGVQLTASDSAIAFQHEDYGTTLRKCQRYCYAIQPEDQFQTNQLVRLAAQTSNGDLRVGKIDFPARMRATPTVENLRANTTNFTGENFYARPNAMTYTCNATTPGTAQFLRLDDTTKPAIFDAEL